MLFSQSCIYGIRAALLVAIRSQKDSDSFTPIRMIAEELNVSFYFLTKILQTLTKARIMESYKGPNGGVRMAMASEDIYLIDIIEAFDEDKVFDSCLLGLPGCRDDDPCPLHKEWKKSKGQLQKVFQRTSLAKLTKEADRLMFRL